MWNDSTCCKQIWSPAPMGQEYPETQGQGAQGHQGQDSLLPRLKISHYLSAGCTHGTLSKGKNWMAPLCLVTNHPEELNGHGTEQTHTKPVQLLASSAPFPRCQSSQKITVLQLWGVQCTKELFVSLLQCFAQFKLLVCAFMKGCEEEPTERLIQRL